MENEIYGVLDNLDDYRNMNKQLHECLNSTRGWYANTLAFQISSDGRLYCDVIFDKLHYDYGLFSLKPTTIKIELDDINYTNRLIRDIIDNRGFVKAIYIRDGYVDILYLPIGEQSVEDDEEMEEEVVKEETTDMRHIKIDNKSMVVELPRFNKNAFEFGEAYFLRMKSVDKAMKLVKYRSHCGDKINTWIPERLDDVAMGLEYGVYGLFKDITYQGTLITFFVGCRHIDIDSNTTKKCVELSIPIDAVDDIEITKLDIDVLTRKEDISYED